MEFTMPTLMKYSVGVYLREYRLYHDNIFLVYLNPAQLLKPCLRVENLESYS
jgi:hypothetical protein